MSHYIMMPPSVAG